MPRSCTAPVGEIRIGPVIWPTRKLRGCKRGLSSSCCENRAPKLSINSTQPSGRIRSGCVDGVSLSSVQKHSTKLLSGGFGLCSQYSIREPYTGADEGGYNPSLIRGHACLEHVAQANDDASIAAVSAPLVQEVCRRNYRIRNTEVSRVSEIEEVSPELQALILADPRVLQNAEINVVDSIRTQGVASCVADPLCRRDRAELCRRMGS